MSALSKRLVMWGGVILAILVILGLYFSAYPYYRSDWTLDRVKAIVSSEIPVGTPRPVVVDVLRNHGISFSAPRGRNDILNAEIPGTSKFLLKEGSVFIVVTFDEADKVKKVAVDEVFTGL